MVYMKLRGYPTLSQPAILALAQGAVNGNQPTAGGMLSAKT